VLQYSVVGVVTRLWAVRPRNRSSISGRRKRFIPSPERPVRLWSAPSLQSKGYPGSFAECRAAGAWRWPLISFQNRV